MDFKFFQLVYPFGWIHWLWHGKLLGDKHQCMDRTKSIIFAFMGKKPTMSSGNHIQLVKKFDHNKELKAMVFVAPVGYNPALRQLTKQEVLNNRPKDARFIFD